MKKCLLLLFFTFFSFSAIHAGTDWKLENGTLTIFGTGNMPEYYGVWDIPWYSNRGKINSIVIEDGVTSIGIYAFRNCSSLTSVTIGNSVMSIGESAFEYCSSLTSVTIPNSVTSIGRYAFAGCSGLTSITIPNSVTSIGERVFYGCSSLTSITIPNSVTSIEEFAFYGCSSLTSITIPNSVKSIGYYAFYDCQSLTSITIPNSVTSIGLATFYGCSGLTSVIIPSSVTSIGKSAFWGCSGLTSITFEGSKHPEFGDDVFGGVNKSIPVYVPANSREEYKNALKDFGLSNIKAIPITLKGSESYTQGSQIEDVDVSYTRNFTNTNWQALYLPFSLKYEDWKDDFEIAYINAVCQYDNNNDGKIDQTVLEVVKINSGSTVPNTPYLIKSKEKGEKTENYQLQILLLCSFSQSSFSCSIVL